jgi:hypothetical protein
MPSPAVERNTAVRATLADELAHTRFRVRSGPGDSVTIHWHDGPSFPTVLAALTHHDPDGRAARYCFHRDVSLESTAVAFLRHPGAVHRVTDPRLRQTRGRMFSNTDLVDAATVTPTERAQATILLALAANQPLWHTNPHTAVFHAACTHRDVALTATT